MKYGNKSQFRRSGAAEKLKGQPNLQEKKLVKVYFNGPAAGWMSNQPISVPGEIT